MSALRLPELGRIASSVPGPANHLAAELNQLGFRNTARCCGADDLPRPGRDDHRRGALGSYRRRAGRGQGERQSDKMRPTMLATVAELWQSSEMPIQPFLARLRERHQRIDRDASELLTFLGEYGYYEARTRARACRTKQDRAGDQHWSRVAVEIAGREGRVIGEKVADRYEAERANPSRPRASSEAARALTDIAQAIADLARGRGNATTLQNVGAWVRQAIDLGGSAPCLVLAGDAVITACDDLAAAEATCSAALRTVIYPVEAELAGAALQRFRAAIDTAGRKT